ncbi:MAG TPA: polysaccharide deacetylase family protein, partial [Actinomycetota bacterium]|nr:polysaccharide deacetylase family protein [Actinomycetota bacterium]
IAGHLDGDRPFWWTEAEDLVRIGGLVPGWEGSSPPEIVRRLKAVPEKRRRAALADLRRTASVPAPPRPQLRGADLGVLTSGGIEVGNHTMTHPCLPRCTDGQVRQEIEDAHTALRAALGRPPTAFAYPNGDWDSRGERLLRHLGYRTGFLFDHALVRRGPGHPLRISRVRVNSTTRVERLGLILSGLHPTLHQVRTRLTGSRAR